MPRSSFTVSNASTKSSKTNRNQQPSLLLLGRKMSFKQVSLFVIVGLMIAAGIYIVLVSRASSANPLPFDLPEQSVLKGSPKKVFAHYFTPYPISQDNQSSTTDYYARNFLDPTGLNGAWFKEGGMLRDRPIPRELKTSTCNLPTLSDPSCYVYQDMKTEVATATSAGLDGFTVDVLGSSGQNWERMKALIAAAPAVDKNFKILLMPDGNGSAAAAGYSSLADHLAGLAKDPAMKNTLYHLDDGRLVIAPFKPETETPAYWQSFISAMNNAGVPVAFVPCFLNYAANVDAYSSFSYGLSNWGNRNPGNNQNLAATIQDAHNRGKKWMQPVSLQDSRPNQHIFDEALNTENFRTTWNAAIDNNAEWVQIPTWNDYSENAQIAPSAHLGYGPLDLTSYYLTRFKSATQSWPTIVRDVIYLSHRVQFAGTSPAVGGGNINLMKLRPNSSPTRDKVEVLSFMTQPSDVRATIGGVTSSAAVPAGVTSSLFDLRAGQVSAVVTRSGTNVLSVTSAFTVLNAFTKQDESYYYTSSGRSGFTYAVPTSTTTTSTITKPTVNNVDLSVAAVTWSPSDPAPGAPVTFRATITNSGSHVSPAGIIHGISFRVDGVPVAWSDTVTTSLAPGASREQTASSGPAGTALWIATAGTHIVTAVVDDVNRITESNENNNALSSTLTPGSPADLVVTSVNIMPFPPTLGSLVTFSATIMNQGKSASQSGIIHGIRFAVDANPVAWSDNSTVTLEPGASRVQTANSGPNGVATWQATSGSHTIEAFVDDVRRLIESNISNNKLSTRISL